MPEPRLLESALRRWPVVLIAFAITTALTLLWVTPKPATYESSGTYVVQPRSQQPDDSVKALDTQIRGTQINATYALIARSDEIKNSAESRLVRVPAHGHLHVEAEAVPGTNALTISARARDATTAHALAVAAGAETIAYVEDLQQPYTLALLDPPKLPSHPVNSRKPLTIVLGALLGLMLGLGLAAILDRIVALRRARRSGTIAPIESPALEGATAQPAVIAPPVAASISAAPADASVDLVAHAISDPAVKRELVRAADGTATYSLGVLKLEAANGGRGDSTNGNGNPPAADADPSEERTWTDPLLHDQALCTGQTLTYLRDGLFAAVLPDMNAVKASQLLSDWLADASAVDTDNPNGGLLVSMTVVEYAGRQSAPAMPEVTSGSEVTSG
jgi:capsular polysaccharide biosynthesis protein